ncbi:UDP-2,4-diacetamido-2,4,6-trideoxy-beta-L-altropyranose hydrolase [Solitalea longa]|uniref:UDP-2,4-diacetamido-2,4, 6-trideoxy-beta-L-altropyranose hydrolase n=1 Tax=Solitalea longa TaxID=2079460 RepID=A0A2S5A959_9SPHI|nr:UDP-2,4-diacetamido-2,4,6-trideoxy-beta-L-altropyranose hydrolase [Solitalea longa]POY39118.1 UDP-2,4-diacetamido-2,4,6-trideoxy-beta-L-altropyranose hydrolase [Solitalea longa]
MKEKAGILFRVDGNSIIGLGHIIRCQAMAHMLKDTFECTFHVRQPSPHLVNDFEKLGYKLNVVADFDDIHVEAREWSKQLNSTDIVVLDGYRFDTQYQQQIKDKGCKLVCIDDIHAYHFVADAIISHSGGIKEEWYSKESYTRLYHGLKYALLRPGFIAEASQKRVLKTVNEHVFICLGGADPNNNTQLVLNNCMDIRASYHLVLGSAFMHQESVDRFISSTQMDVKVYYNLSEMEMIKLMKKCDRAICSPSSISMEYLCIKGILYLLLTADNQQHLYNYYLENNLAKDFNTFADPNADINWTLLTQLFDGNQKERIIELIKSI